MTKVNSMTADDHALVTAAVSHAEKSTDGEIVTIVAHHSDTYRETPLHVASLALLLYLVSIAVFPDWFQSLPSLFTGGWAHDYSVTEYLSLLIGGAITVFVLVWWLVSATALRVVLTPGFVRQKRVRDKAIELFKVGAERRTMGLTGILIYLSMAEHRAEIVADEAIAQVTEPETWGEAMAALIIEVKQGHPGQGMANAVEKVGVVLAGHFPKTDANPNELPDRLIEL